MINARSTSEYPTNSTPTTNGNVEKDEEGLDKVFYPILPYGFKGGFDMTGWISKIGHITQPPRLVGSISLVRDSRAGLVIHLENKNSLSHSHSLEQEQTTNFNYNHDNNNDKNNKNKKHNSQALGADSTSHMFRNRDRTTSSSSSSSASASSSEHDSSNNSKHTVGDGDHNDLAFDVDVDDRLTAISFPDQLSYIGTSLPILNLHVCNVGAYFAFAIEIQDDKDETRIIQVANYQSIARVSGRRADLPLKLTSGWNKLHVDLARVCEVAFKVGYKQAIRVVVYASCRLRRIYFSDRVYQHDRELPACLRLSQKKKATS